MTIDHLCRRRTCVNPGHMETVTSAVNTMRADSLGPKNARKAHCPKGHTYDEANTYINGKGHRICRACNRERQARLREAS